MASRSSTAASVRPSMRTPRVHSNEPVIRRGSRRYSDQNPSASPRFALTRARPMTTHGDTPLVAAARSESASASCHRPRRSYASPRQSKASGPTLAFSLRLVEIADGTLRLSEEQVHRSTPAQRELHAARRGLLQLCARFFVSTGPEVHRGAPYHGHLDFIRQSL